MAKIFVQSILSIIAVGLIYFVIDSYYHANAVQADNLKRAKELQPLPGISPQKVVDLQIQAMQQNDQPYEDHGIAIAYRFASPENKKNTGPLERFSEMVKNEMYKSLLYAKRYGLDAIEIDGDLAVQKVTLIDAQDEPVVYFFQLSRQIEGPYKDCWMTDSVVRY